MATARSRKPAAAADERTLLVERRGEKFKITIPADWKVTFGKSMQGRGFDEGRELRIYEAETKQRACFTDVMSFRDLSIPLIRLVKEQSGEEKWENDGLGNGSRTSKTSAKVREVEEIY